MFSQRAHALDRRARETRDRRPELETVLLECGHETTDVPVVRFSDGRERYACDQCNGRLQREKGAR